MTVSYLKGTKTRRTAFSWTCHPNKNDVQPDSVKAVKNDLYEGFLQSLDNHTCKIEYETRLDVKSMPRTSWNAIVIAKVWIGLIFGITAKTVSPTKPREVETTPASLIGILAPVNCTTVMRCMSTRKNRNGNKQLTFQKGSVKSRNQCPNVRGPVCVI